MENRIFLTGFILGTIFSYTGITSFIAGLATGVILIEILPNLEKYKLVLSEPDLRSKLIYISNPIENEKIETLSYKLYSKMKNFINFLK